MVWGAFNLHANHQITFLEATAHRQLVMAIKALGLFRCFAIASTQSLFSFWLGKLAITQTPWLANLSIHSIHTHLLNSRYRNTSQKSGQTFWSTSTTLPFSQPSPSSSVSGPRWASMWPSHDSHMVLTLPIHCVYKIGFWLSKPFYPYLSVLLHKW